jgi:hypothetical protein
VLTPLRHVSLAGLSGTTRCRCSRRGCWGRTPSTSS